MQSQVEFEALRRESASWWAVSQRKLMQETIAKALRGKREGRVLDLGCAAQLNFEDAAAFRVVNAHGSVPVLAFHQIEGRANLVCTHPEELAFTSNCFDTVMCGDLLQSATDDRAVLRAIRRVLKDGGLLCVTVPAYMFLWGEEDEEAGHQRRYTASELRRKLTTCGFEIQRVSHFVATGFLPSTIDRAGKNLFKKTAARLPRSSV